VTIGGKVSKVNLMNKVTSLSVPFSPTMDKSILKLIEIVVMSMLRSAKDEQFVFTLVFTKDKLDT